MIQPRRIRIILRRLIDSFEPKDGAEFRMDVDEPCDDYGPRYRALVVVVVWGGVEFYLGGAVSGEHLVGWIREQERSEVD